MSSRSGSAAAASTGSTPRRASSSSGASSPRGSGTPSTRSRSPKPRTATRSGSPSRTSATTARGSGGSRSGHASSPKAHSVSSPTRARSHSKTLLIAGGIGITPVRALLEQIDGDLVALYRVVSSSDIVFADELERIAAERGARVEYVVGDHSTEQRPRPPLAEPSRGARPRHRRTRRLHLWAGRHDRQHRPQPTPRERPPPPPPRRAVRPVTPSGRQSSVAGLTLGRAGPRILIGRLPRRGDLDGSSAPHPRPR